MVNRGPSTGCKRCRERHTRCDKTRPSCLRCIKRGCICPGYRDIGGIIFKDQSRAVTERQSRRLHAVAKQAVSLSSRKLQPDSWAIVIPFFFEHYVLHTNQTGSTSRGRFDHLIALYRQAMPSSPLALATFATAARAIATHLGLAQNTSWHTKNDAAANQAVMGAIQDLEESLGDKLILAVLCLDFGTHFSQRTTFKAPSRTHLDGALALIHHCGTRNFESSVARSLFAATRSNVLLQTLWYADKRSEHAVTSFPDVKVGVDNPIMHLHYILLKVIKLDMAVVANDCPANQHQRLLRLELAQHLQAELDAWLRDLPLEWITIAEASSVYLNASDAMRCMPFYHVVSLIGQWHCTRLMVLICRNVDMQRAFPSQARDYNRYESVILEAQATFDSLCELLNCVETYSSSNTGNRQLLGATVRAPPTDSSCGPDIVPVILANILGWVLGTL